MQNIFVTKKCLDEIINNLPTPEASTPKVKVGTSSPIATVEAPAVLLKADEAVPEQLKAFAGVVTELGSVTAPTAGAYSLNIRTIVRALSPVPFRVQGVEALQLEVSTDGTTFHPVVGAQWAGPSHGGDEDNVDAGMLVHNSTGFVDVYLPAGDSKISVRAQIASNHPTTSATYNAVIGVDLAYITLADFVVAV